MKDEITICFYNTFSYEIAQMRTVAQKIDILDRMQQTFCEAVRNKPSIRDEISEVYQQLKVRCENAA